MADQTDAPHGAKNGAVFLDGQEGGLEMSKPVKDYPPYLDYPKPRKKQTNADRIRAMSDEELAKIICCQDSRHGDECINTPCAECILDWLKQEVSE